MVGPFCVPFVIGRSTLLELDGPDQFYRDTFMRTASSLQRHKVRLCIQLLKCAAVATDVTALKNSIATLHILKAFHKRFIVLCIVECHRFFVTLVTQLHSILNAFIVKTGHHVVSVTDSLKNCFSIVLTIASNVDGKVQTLRQHITVLNSVD